MEFIVDESCGKCTPCVLAQHAGVVDRYLRRRGTTET
ncbi:MAG: NADH-ubiquinone oxidoreductase-F iron-sulfur binding region domain-containing protein [Holdemania massiliensis]